MTDVRSRGLTSAQIYLWATAFYLVILGAGSLIIHPSFPTGDQVPVEYLFGIFVTNGWHGLVGLATGLTALAFARSRRWDRTVAAGIGVGLAASAVLFFLSGEGSVAVGLVPVALRDAILLHLLPGVAGVVCAAVSPSRKGWSDDLSPSRATVGRYRS